MLEEVRQRAVPDVVQERGRESLARTVARDPLRLGQAAADRAQAREQELHDEGGAESVGEARVLRTGESKRGHPELPYATKALHLGGVDQSLDNALLVSLERDEPMDGVA
jgi:hypothetical protein